MNGSLPPLSDHKKNLRSGRLFVFFILIIIFLSSQEGGSSKRISDKSRRIPFPQKTLCPYNKMSIQFKDKIP
jgi:hypothetical protein